MTGLKYVNYCKRKITRAEEVRTKHRAKLICRLIVYCTSFALILYLSPLNLYTEYFYKMRDSFSVKKIVIYGSKILGETEVAGYIKDYFGKNIYSISAAEVRKRLEKQEAIQKAIVYLKVPDTLVVFVTERHPVAIWVNDGGRIFLDAAGKSIPDHSEGDVGYVELFGDNANLHFEAIYRLMKRSEYFEDIISMTFVGNRRWDVHMRDGKLVKLPANNIEGAIEVWNSLETEKMAMIDLRFVPKAVYFRPR